MSDENWHVTSAEVREYAANMTDAELEDALTRGLSARVRAAVQRERALRALDEPDTT
jgi:hypothetical protein